MSDKEGNYWTPLRASEVIWRTMSSVLYWTWEKMQTNWIASRKKIIGTSEKFLKPKQNRTKQNKTKQNNGWKNYGCYFESLKDKGGTGEFSDTLKGFIKRHVINYST